MDLKDKPTEKLIGQMKALKIISIALITVLFLLLAVSIYGMLQGEKTSVYVSLIAVAFSLSAMVPMMLLSISKIKKELASRE